MKILYFFARLFYSNKLTCKDFITKKNLKSFFCIQYSFTLKLSKFFNQILDRTFTMDFVVSCTNVNTLICHFFFSDHQNEIKLSKLCISYFLVYSQARITFNFSFKSSIIQLPFNIFSVFITTWSYGKDNGLSWR